MNMKHKYSTCVLLEQRLLFSLFESNSVTNHESAKFSLPVSRLFLVAMVSVERLFHVQVLLA